MFSGTPLPVPLRPNKVAADLLGLFLGVGHQYLEQIPEVLWTGFIASLLGGVDVDLLQPFGGLHDGAQVHVRVSVFGGPDHALGAARAGEPDVGPGFLHGQHPRIDHPVLIILSLVPEGTRLGPAFNDEVVGLLEPFPVLGGVDPSLEGLDSPSPNKPGYDPAPGITIKHGHLFGHSDGVVDGDHVAENSDLDILGDLGQDGGIQVDRRFGAPVGGVVLVGHDAVEPDLVGQDVLFVVFVVELVGLVGVEVGVWKRQST